MKACLGEIIAIYLFPSPIAKQQKAQRGYRGRNQLIIKTTYIRLQCWQKSSKWNNSLQSHGSRPSRYWTQTRRVPGFHAIQSYHGYSNSWITNQTCFILQGCHMNVMACQITSPMFRITGLCESAVDRYSSDSVMRKAFPCNIMLDTSLIWVTIGSDNSLSTVCRNAIN